jgi:hypothetical protein
MGNDVSDFKPTMWWEIREERIRKAHEAEARRRWGWKHWGEYHWGLCPVCDMRFEHPMTGHRRVYCKNACKQRAYRQRKADREEAFFRQLAARAELWSPSLVDRIRDFFGWW